MGNNKPFLEKKALPKERNPAYFCNCGVYLGHRGFCSKKCHDEYYDSLPCAECGQSFSHTERCGIGIWKRLETK
ncbi:MAG: hypothetical protein KGH64_05270 [Candidatus Micrarchaeota archaeon]|nr:hypothetical protein [Candidatus Micrarchaeota archaeon]